MLRSKVQHLLELHFTSAQFLFCSFTFSDVDHGAHKFPDIARLVQDWVTNVVDVLYRSVRENNSVVRFEVGLRQIRPFVALRFNRPVLRMNSAKKEFGGWFVLPGSNVENPVHLRRDRDDPRQHVMSPTARVAKSLSLKEIRFTAPEGFLGRLTLGDVGHRADKLAIA